MTVGRLFSILFQILLVPLTLYWTIPLYINNNGNYNFDELWYDKKIESFSFNISFVAFIIFSFMMFLTFIAYLRQNKGKSAAIVFSPKYLKNDYWKDVDKFFT